MSNYLFGIRRLGRSEPIGIHGVQEDTKTTAEGVLVKIRINENNFEWIPIRDTFSDIYERDRELNRLRIQRSEKVECSYRDDNDNDGE